MSELLNTLRDVQINLNFFNTVKLITNLFFALTDHHTASWSLKHITVIVITKSDFNFCFKDITLDQRHPLL